jgi:hypothetical protein
MQFIEDLTWQTHAAQLSLSDNEFSLKHHQSELNQ